MAAAAGTGHCPITLCHRFREPRDPMAALKRNYAVAWLGSALFSPCCALDNGGMACRMFEDRNEQGLMESQSVRTSRHIHRKHGELTQCKYKANTNTKHNADTLHTNHC